MEKYLDSIVGKRLFKDEKKELIEFIDLKQNGRLMKGYESLNACFKERKIQYIILNKRSSERINGKVESYRYWEIAKLEDKLI